MEPVYAKKLMDSTFEEIALMFGGIFAVHGVADEVVWQIMKHLDLAYENALSKLDGIESKAGKFTSAKHRYTPHPAVETMLIKLRKQTPFNKEHK